MVVLQKLNHGFKVPCITFEQLFDKHLQNKKQNDKLLFYDTDFITASEREYKLVCVITFYHATK